MKKQIAVILLFIIALGFGGAWLNAKGTDAASMGLHKKSALLASEQINVSFQQVGGQVIELLVEKSQFVEKGTPLIKLDTHDTDLQLEQLEVQMTMLDNQILQAKASLHDYDIKSQQLLVQKAQEDLALVQKNYERFKILFGSGAVSEADLEGAEQKLHLAENTLKQNQNLLEKLQNNLELSATNVILIEGQREILDIQKKALQTQKKRMILKAPRDGQVLTLIPKIGENVVPNSPVIIIQGSKLFFDIYVSETQVNNFVVGKTIPVHVVASNQTLNGTVDYIINAPPFASAKMSRDNSQADISSFQIRIELQEGIQDLYAGMTVEVELDGTN